MPLLLVLALAAADPDACSLAKPFEKQLAIVRAPLPPAKGRSSTDEEAERMLRALATVEPAAIDELVALKTRGRARLGAFLATLQKGSTLYSAVELGTLPGVDYQLTQAANLKKLFTAERAAEARRRLAEKQLAGWEKLFATDEEQQKTDLDAITRSADMNPGRWEPYVAWFGAGVPVPSISCASGKTAGSVLMDAGTLAYGGGGGWEALLEGVDLDGWARISARVDRMDMVEMKTGCGPSKADPKVRYDAAKRTVEFDWVFVEGCFEALSRKLQMHAAMPTRKAGEVTPKPDWRPLREKLLAR